MPCLCPRDTNSPGSVGNLKDNDTKWLIRITKIVMKLSPTAHGLQSAPSVLPFCGPFYSLHMPVILLWQDSLRKPGNTQRFLNLLLCLKALILSLRCHWPQPSYY